MYDSSSTIVQNCRTKKNNDEQFLNIIFAYEGDPYTNASIWLGSPLETWPHELQGGEKLFSSRQRMIPFCIEEHNKHSSLFLVRDDPKYFKEV